MASVASAQPAGDGQVQLARDEPASQAEPPGEEAGDTPPSKQAAADARCVSAFERAQLDRMAGKLLQSRAQLVECARAQCPPIIVEKCVPWLSEVRRAIPSVVVAAQDSSGADIAAVRVFVDGREHSRQLDGRPIEVNPGLRRFRFEHDGAHPIDKQLLLVEGAKARTIELRFEALAGTEPGLLDRPISPVAIAGFAVAGAGVLVGTITGIVALQRGAEIAERCPDKRCGTTDPELPDYYTQSQTLAHVSTVSLALAGAGAVVGVIGLFIDTGEAEPESAQLSLQLGPASVGLAGVF